MDMRADRHDVVSDAFEDQVKARYEDGVIPIRNVPELLQSVYV